MWDMDKIRYVSAAEELNLDNMIGWHQLSLLMEFIGYDLRLKHGDTVQWATVEGASEDAHDSADGGGSSQAPGAASATAAAPTQIAGTMPLTKDCGLR